MSKRKIKIQIDNEGQAPIFAIVKGRDLWALEQLMQGPCTPITKPAPRWSAYIYKLRGFGVVIETEHEPHDGPFPGHHARYHLKSKITFLENEVKAAA